MPTIDDFGGLRLLPQAAIRLRSAPIATQYGAPARYGAAPCGAMAAYARYFRAVVLAFYR